MPIDLKTKKFGRVSHLFNGTQHYSRTGAKVLIIDEYYFLKSEDRKASMLLSR
jgi:hypothetical protein